MDEICQRFARKVWDARQTEFNYHIRENEFPKFTKAIKTMMLDMLPEKAPHAESFQKKRWTAGYNKAIDDFRAKIESL